MPDGEAKEIELSSWADYENSDAISIIGKNGEHIYTHLKLYSSFTQPPFIYFIGFYSIA